MSDKVKELPTTTSESDRAVSTQRPLTIRKRHGSARGKLREIALAAFVAGSAFGVGNAFGNEVGKTTPAPVSAENLPQFTPSPTEAGNSENPESETDVLKNQIKEKYGIDILVGREIYDRIKSERARNGETGIGLEWSLDQIKMFDEFLGYIPSKLIAPRTVGTSYNYAGVSDDNRVAFSMADFKVAGDYIGQFDLVQLTKNWGTNNRWGAFSLIVHELGHRGDGPILREKISEIMGEQNYMEKGMLKDYVQQQGIDDAKGLYLASRVLKSYFNPGSIQEGIAGLNQMYVRGRDEFTKSIGHFLDLNDKGTGSRANALYNLLKNEVFDGKEYDYSLVRLIEYGQEEEKKLSDLNKKIQAIEKENGTQLDIQADTELNSNQIINLKNVLTSFPSELINSNNTKDLKIIITTRNNLGSTHQLNPDAVVLTQDDLLGRGMSAMKLIGGRLIATKDEMDGGKITKDLINILGGDDFLNNPTRLHPRLNDQNLFGDALYYKNALISKDPKKIMEAFGYAFIDINDSILVYFLDPDNLDFEKTKYLKAYNLIMNEMFKGKQFISNDYEKLPTLIAI